MTLTLIDIALVYVACCAAIVTGVIAAQHGDFAAMIGKAVANVRSRMPVQTFKIRMLDGSPACKFSWADFFVWFGNLLKVAACAALAYATQHTFPGIDQSTPVGLLIMGAYTSAITFLQRLVSDTTK